MLTKNSKQHRCILFTKNHFLISLFVFREEVWKYGGNQYYLKIRVISLLALYS